jgi:hypothetical protein
MNELKFMVPRIELQILRLKPSLIFDPPVVPRSCPGQPDGRFDVEQDRHFRLESVTHELGKPGYKIEWNSSSITLVRHRRMVKAIADHHLASIEGGFDFLQYVLAPRCVKEKQLRRGSEMDRLGIQKDFSNAFSNRRSPRFARDGMGNRTAIQKLGEPRNLSRLPATFNTLETNEPPVFHV